MEPIITLTKVFSEEKDKTLRDGNNLHCYSWKGWKLGGVKKKGGGRRKGAEEGMGFGVNVTTRVIYRKLRDAAGGRGLSFGPGQSTPF
jgi:hypothetical protein